MIKKKKNKFAIVVDEQGRNKNYLRKLINLLDDKYDFLKQQSALLRDKAITKAKYGDVIVFGSSSNSDFTVMDPIDFEEIEEGFRTVDLLEEFSVVKKLLAKYAKANYPHKFEAEEYYCFAAAPRRSSYDNLVVIEIESPKRTTRRNTSSNLTLNEVFVYTNYVQVGWDTYRIRKNSCGDQYVKINGKTYWVDRDVYGNGKLSTR